MNIAEFAEDEFLIGFLEGTQELVATNIQAIKRALNKKLDANEEESEYTVFSYVGSQVAQQLSKDGGLRREIGMRIFYDATCRKLIVKIPTGLHGGATETLSFLILEAASRQGLRGKLRPAGAQTFVDGPYRKEPDAAFIPEVPIPGRDRTWPTIVIETGVSESVARLRIDASWWLARSKGLVKLVILISVSRVQPKVGLECWKLGAVQHSHNLRSLSQAPLRPTKTQSITITRSGGSTMVMGAPLVIQFQDVFVNPPSGPLQGDFVFGAALLEEIARSVWQAQGII
ncbi:hypothetical protein ABOM_009992 [Aspergillus bombycis]|uniref:Uncharacterized protein n=1 Tax=Aspergillus bombycis TaxID=109264 RepID=A0A1F7ZQW4_9EURO|nr:hypothetical protein ABOM_009992 [Aspergillus bombycis]OGM41669.1 hypothetical protein ABOM_009992 [Aspergillus bombycis]